MASREVIAVDIAFARLELLELDHGRRTLTQCPGLKAMAAHIREAEIKGHTHVLGRTRMVDGDAVIPCTVPGCGYTEPGERSP